MSSNGFFIGPDSEPDKYRLITQVGSGGEAQLWKAELTVAGQSEPVAVKILRPDRLSALADWKTRWAEQAELLHFIRHPGVVGIREHFEGWPMHHGRETLAGTTPRSLYLIMNWVEGSALREWVPLHRSAEDHFEGLRHLAQLGDVLDWLHSGQATPSGRQIIHADVTPANVLLTDVGQAVLVDFGLVRVVGGVADTVEGTRGYMAPEVLESGEYSAASDRYAFGALTYFVLTGDHPPTDPNAVYAKLSQVPVVAAQPELARHLMGMFNPDPNGRPPAGEWIRRFRVSSSTATAMGGLRSGAPRPARTVPTTAQHAEPPKRRLRFGIFVGFASLLVLVAAAALIVSRSGSGGGGPTLASGTAPTSTGLARVGSPTSSLSSTSTSTPSITSTTAGSGFTRYASENSAYVASWKAVEGEADTGKAKANAVSYEHAVIQDVYCDGTRYVDFDLSRAWKRLKTTVALRDDSTAGTPVKFAMYIDSAKVESGELKLGQFLTIDRDVTNALRVRFEMTAPCYSRTYLVWGDPQVTK